MIDNYSRDGKDSKNVTRDMKGFRDARDSRKVSDSRDDRGS